MNRNKLREELLSRKSISKRYRELYQPLINGKQKQYKNVFLGVQKIQQTEPDIDTDSDSDSD